MSGIHWFDVGVGALMWLGVGLGLWWSIVLDDRHAQRLRRRDEKEAHPLGGEARPVRSPRGSA